VHGAAQLSEFLHGTVHRIPGVRHTECSLGARFVKHDYRISRIVATGSPEARAQDA